MPTWQILLVGMQDYESVLKGSEDGTDWCTWKWPIWFPTLVRYSGIDKSICINMAPLACAQTLGTLKEWNRWYDNSMHMCQFCKVHYLQVFATFKHATLYVTVRIAWFRCFIHHVFLHSVLENGSVPFLKVWVGCYSGESHRYLCSITGHLTAGPNQFGAPQPFHPRMGRDSVLETYFFHMIQKKCGNNIIQRVVVYVSPSFRKPPTCLSFSTWFPHVLFVLHFKSLLYNLRRWKSIYLADSQCHITRLDCKLMWH